MGTKARGFAGALIGVTLLCGSCGRGGDGADPEVAGADITAAPTTEATLPPTTAPPVTTQVTYLVVSGDSLSVIASRFGVSTQALADFNAITDADTLQVGQELAIPPAATPADTSTATPADTSTTVAP